jgi:hypothetical protein|uniref:Uncharacterized protein n=1 Tax=Zea mays TaxID=4577 RepID=A0A804N6V4_MAIZE
MTSAIAFTGADLGTHPAIECNNADDVGEPEASYEQQRPLRWRATVEVVAVLVDDTPASPSWCPAPAPPRLWLESRLSTLCTRYSTRLQHGVAVGEPPQGVAGITWI